MANMTNLTLMAVMALATANTAFTGSTLHIDLSACDAIGYGQDRCATGACDRSFKPVCGDDGRTYNNMCLACCAYAAGQHKGLTIVRPGACPEPQINTAASSYDMQQMCFPRTHYTSRLCKKAPFGLGAGCPKIFMPVCAANGKTYGNMCAACCAFVGGQDGAFETAVDGVCPPTSAVAPQSQPQSANTNSNSVSMNLSNVCAAPTYVHACLNGKALCTREYRPLCGSDGQNYGNVCMACCAFRNGWSDGLTAVTEGSLSGRANVELRCRCMNNLYYNQRAGRC